MHKNSRILLIQDVRSFCLMIVDFCRADAMRAINLNASEHVDLFIDWSIDEILTHVFNFKVVGHRRIDEYKCLLDQIHVLAIRTLSASINTHDLELIRGSEVKTMVTGYDLFISPRTTYRYYL